MEEKRLVPEKGLYLAMENGEMVLKNNVGGVELTMSFAKEEPARNAKEACLSIIGHQYANNLTKRA